MNQISTRVDLRFDDQDTETLNKIVEKFYPTNPTNKMAATIKKLIYGYEEYQKRIGSMEEENRELRARLKEAMYLLTQTDKLEKMKVELDKERRIFLNKQPFI